MAEVNALHNRYQNGILKDDRSLTSTDVRMSLSALQQVFVLILVVKLY